MKLRSIKLAIFLVSLFVFFACSGIDSGNGSVSGSVNKLKVTSNDITAGGTIDDRHAKTLDIAPGGCGVNVVGAMNESPHLAWTWNKNTDSRTKSYAITMTDEDATNFIHWVIWDIPASVSSLQRSVVVPQQVSQLQNGFGAAGYGGPCPPANTTHTYTFTVYALSVEKLNPNPLTLTGVATAIRANTLGDGTLQATFTSSGF